MEKVELVCQDKIFYVTHWKLLSKSKTYLTYFEKDNNAERKLILNDYTRDEVQAIVDYVENDVFPVGKDLYVFAKYLGISDLECKIARKDGALCHPIEDIFDKDTIKTMKDLGKDYNYGIMNVMNKAKKFGDLRRGDMVDCVGEIFFYDGQLFVEHTHDDETIPECFANDIPKYFPLDYWKKYCSNVFFNLGPHYAEITENARLEICKEKEDNYITSTFGRDGVTFTVSFNSNIYTNIKAFIHFNKAEFVRILKAEFVRILCLNTSCFQKVLVRSSNDFVCTITGK